MRGDNSSPMGGPGKAIQVDETYFGSKDVVRGKKWPEKKGLSKKRSVVTLVEPGGSVRSFNVKTANARTVREILVRHISRKSELHTDESRIYTKLGKEFAAHRTVVHARGQYVGPSGESTNAVETYFSVFKRGMRGVYQHCQEKHLHRYLAEFDFRYNTRKIEDATRADMALRGIEGKRLTYGRSQGW